MKNERHNLDLVDIADDMDGFDTPCPATRIRQILPSFLP